MKKGHILLVFVLFLINVNYAQTDQEESLREIASTLRNDNTGKTEIKKLRPTQEDLEAIFIKPESVKLVSDYLEKMFATIDEDRGVDPGTHRSETIVFKIKSNYLKVGVPHQLPGGYNWIKDEFKDFITIYGLKFVEPGKTSGYSLNAFFFVNNHWVCIPKVYRAFPRED